MGDAAGILDNAAAAVPGLVVFCVFALALVWVVLRYLAGRDREFAKVLREVSGTCHAVSDGMTKAGFEMARSSAATAEVLRDVKNELAQSRRRPPAPAPAGGP